MLAQLVLNEQSRRGREFAPRVRDALRGSRIDFVEAEVPPDAVDCIVGAGGDGTILGCVAAAIALGLPLGIVPLGTFNELARTLDIPLDIEGAVSVIAGGTERAIDVGVVNEKYFVNEASIGISSRISRLQTPELKQRFGFLAIFATALQAARHSRPIHVRLDSSDDKRESFRTIQLTVANSHRFGGFVQVSDAAIDDGFLDLYSVDIRHFYQAFPIARAMFAGQHSGVPGLRRRRAKSFDVHTKHHHRVTADGEPAGHTPARFDVLPKALRVFVPK